MPSKVAYMHKITCSLEFDDADPGRASPSFPTIVFVYGLSASGLTPFEFDLAEKTTGDEIQISLHADQIPAYFGHIRIPAVQAAGQAVAIVLKARILEISPANSREVVRTLADIANCGDSCCGHHFPAEGGSDENCR